MTGKEYVAGLRPGNTVRIHPAHDLFMRGVVYATVTSVGPKWVYFRHETSRTNHRMSRAVAAEYLLHEGNNPC